MDIRRHQQSGMTLVETMLAAAVLLLLTLVLFEGISLGFRVTKENSEHLAADALAYDTLWRLFNWNFEDLIKYKGGNRITISEDDAPVLYNASLPETATLSYSITPSANKSTCTIMVNVEWYSSGHQVSLTNDFSPRLPYVVTRSAMARAAE